MLLKLIQALQGSDIASTVLCLRPPGRLGKEISALDIPLYSLDMQRALPGFADISRLRRLTRAIQPDIVQGWMYHGNLAATVAAGAIQPRAALAWNIRGTSYDLKRERPATRWVIRLGGWLSGVPEAIVHNAASSVAGHHQHLRYRDTHATIIGNGFDIQRFQPNQTVRESIRAELQLPANALVFGHFARWHPMKDHALLIGALGRIIPQHAEIHCLMAGTGIDSHNTELMTAIQKNHLQHHVHLLGERRDIHRLAAAVDFGILCSAWGEAFPNSVGELMCSGAPCIVTAVGDSAALVGDTGWVIPPGSQDGLINAILECAALDSEARSQKSGRAREKIKTTYALPVIAEKYAELYRQLSSVPRQ